MAKQKNKILLAKNIQKLIDENYEKENQSKSKSAAYRKIIRKIYPMSERTFWRLANIDVPDDVSQQKDSRQLSLF